MAVSLVRKSTWLIAGHVLANGLSFVFFLALARTIGAGGMGDYSFAFGVAGLLGLGVNFGFRYLLTREAARAPEIVNRRAGNVVLLQTALALTGIAAIVILGTAMDYSAALRVLILIAFVAVALKEIGGTFVAFLEAAEAMERSAALEVLARAVLFTAGLLMILAGLELRLVMLAHVAAGAVFLAAAAGSTRRLYGPLSFRPDPGPTLRGLRTALPFFAATVLYELYARVDVIMLHQISGEVETGLYSVAVKLQSAPIFVASLIGVAVYPALARSQGQGTRRGELFLGSLKWIGVLGMAGAIVFLLVGEALTATFFGDEFAVSGRLLEWMAVLFLIQFVAVPYWRLLYALERERLVVGLYAVSMALNVALNLLLIPRWGAFGAVWASIASEGVHWVALHVVCSRIVMAPYLRMAARLLFAGGATWAVLALVVRWAPWPLVLMLVPAVLLAFSIAVRIVKLDDWRQLRNAFDYR